MAERFRTRGGDPHWITAKYPGKDRDGRVFAKGEMVFFYPNTKTILSGEPAKQAARDFAAESQDDSFAHSQFGVGA